MFHCLVIKVVSLLFSKQLVHIITCSSVCQQLFWTSFDWEIQNGEGGIWTLAPLLTTYSLSRGAPSATWVLLQLNKFKIYNMVKYHKRRRWDSNPRPLSESPVFKTGSLNHSDTSPKTAWTVYHPHTHLVKHKFPKATSHAKKRKTNFVGSLLT